MRMFFFFQAEDGIRDIGVTGVQTCALPISAFPLIKDLAVDRSALDRIIQAGGYISAPTGTAPEAHSILVAKKDSDAAFDAATCIGCGACVAACPNASSMLFTSSKVVHLGLMPQGQPERNDRVVRSEEHT